MNAKIPTDARCLGCGYALRGLPGNVCPECGRVFDPNDPSTYRQGPHRPYWRRWAGPPRSWHAALATGLTVGLLVGYSEPGRLSVLPTGSGPCCLFGPVALLLIVALTVNYGAHAAATLLDAVRASFDRSPPMKRSRLRWVVLPVCLAVLCSAAATRWPMLVRFHLSRAALEKAARSYLTGANARQHPGRIGLYHFEHVHREGAGVGFMKTYPIWRSIGFFHSPQDSPPTKEVLWSTRIGPQWFVFEWDF